jgi:diacylglycerol kinase (ATP)
VFWGSLVGLDYAARILAPVEASLFVDQHPAPLEGLTLLVCSVFNDVGLGLRPTYRAGAEPDRLHLVATDLRARRLGPQAWRVLLGRPLVASRLVDELVREFSVEFMTSTALILDGDAVQARRVRVGIGPECRVWSS